MFVFFSSLLFVCSGSFTCCCCCCCSLNTVNLLDTIQSCACVFISLNFTSMSCSLAWQDEFSNIQNQSNFLCNRVQAVGYNLIYMFMHMRSNFSNLNISLSLPLRLSLSLSVSRDPLRAASNLKLATCKQSYTAAQSLAGCCFPETPSGMWLLSVNQQSFFSSLPDRNTQTGKEEKGKLARLVRLERREKLEGE